MLTIIGANPSFVGHAGLRTPIVYDREADVAFKVGTKQRDTIAKYEFDWFARGGAIEKLPEEKLIPDEPWNSPPIVAYARADLLHRFSEMEEDVRDGYDVKLVRESEFEIRERLTPLEERVVRASPTINRKYYYWIGYKAREMEMLNRWSAILCNHFDRLWNESKTPPQSLEDIPWEVSNCSFTEEGVRQGFGRLFRYYLKSHDERSAEKKFLFGIHVMVGGLSWKTFRSQYVLEDGNGEK